MFTYLIPRVKKILACIFPYSIIRFLRENYDRMLYRKTAATQKLGIGSAWHIDTLYLTQKSIVYSGGVGHDISFEKELVQRFGCSIYLFDPSPTGKVTMHKPENYHIKLQYFQQGLGGVDGDLLFDMPSDVSEGSYRKINTGTQGLLTFPCRSLNSLMKEFGHDHIDLLKIDIEGFEYEVLDHMFDAHIPITQICVEFHDFLDGIPIWKTTHMIKRLKQHGYEIIYKDMKDYTFLLTSSVYAQK